MNSKQKFESINFTEIHPNAIPLIIDSIQDVKTTHKLSFAIEHLVNKTHKLEEMQNKGILDVTFVRVQKNFDEAKWYFEGSSHARNNDLLTQELERLFKFRKVNLVPPPPIFTSYKEYKETQVPKTPTKDTNFTINELIDKKILSPERPKLPDDRYDGFDARLPFLNYLRKLFARNKK